jgi:hypothetical protein
LTLEDGTDGLSRNVGKGLPLDAASYLRRAQMLSTLRRMPEITDVKEEFQRDIQLMFGIDLFMKL